MSISKLRARASKVNREQHALFALLQETTVIEFETLKRNEEFIRHGSEQGLRDFIAKVGGQNSKVRKQLGVKMSEDLDTLFSDVAGAPKGTILYFTKDYLVTLCRNYEVVIPDIARLPSRS